MKNTLENQTSVAKKTDILIIAIATAKPGKEKELEKALMDVADPTRQQPGCVSFSLCRSKENPAVVIGLERWATEADHDKHLQGEHVKKLFGALADVLAGPPVITTNVIINEI